MSGVERDLWYPPETRSLTSFKIIRINTDTKRAASKHIRKMEWTKTSDPLINRKWERAISCGVLVQGELFLKRLEQEETLRIFLFEYISLSIFALSIFLFVAISKECLPYVEVCEYYSETFEMSFGTAKRPSPKRQKSYYKWVHALKSAPWFRLPDCIGKADDAMKTIPVAIFQRLLSTRFD